MTYPIPDNAKKHIERAPSGTPDQDCVSFNDFRVRIKCPEQTPERFKEVFAGGGFSSCLKDVNGTLRLVGYVLRPEETASSGRHSNGRSARSPPALTGDTRSYTELYEMVRILMEEMRTLRNTVNTMVGTLENLRQKLEK